MVGMEELRKTRSQIHILRASFVANQVEGIAEFHHGVVESEESEVRM